MYHIHLTIPIPHFVAYAPLIILSYLAIGLVVGVVETLWVIFRDQGHRVGYPNDNTLLKLKTWNKKGGTLKLKGWVLLWLYILIAQRLVKAYGVDVSRFSLIKTSRSDVKRKDNTCEVRASAKWLKAGDVIRFRPNTWDDDTKNYMVEGKLIRNYRSLNLSSLIIKDFGTVVKENGELGYVLVGPIEKIKKADTSAIA